MIDVIVNNWKIIFWIISIIWWIASSIWWVIQYFKNQKAQIEIEKLKSKLEIEKDKNLLNDRKFREAYEEFISLMFELLNKKKVNIEEWMVNFMKKTLLFAGPKTIKSFSLYRKEVWTKDPKNIILSLEDLILSMREDLGVSNEWLERYDILQTFIVWDLKTEIEKLKRPNNFKN